MKCNDPAGNKEEPGAEREFEADEFPLCPEFRNRAGCHAAELAVQLLGIFAGLG